MLTGHGGRPRRSALAALAGPAVVALVLVLAGRGAGATCPGTCQTITSSPLVVKVAADTATQVYFGGEPGGQVYSPSSERGNAGTFVAVDGQTFGPNGVTAYTGMASQTPVSGNGSATAPFTVVTVVGLGSTGLRMTETTRLVTGQPFFRIDRTIQNQGTAAKTVSVFHYADLYLRGSDVGFGYFEPATRSIGGQTPTADFFQVFTPITPPSHHQEGAFRDVFSRITGVAGGAGPLTDTLLPPPDPANSVDNGAALQWDVQVPAGQSRTISDFWSFGVTPQVPRLPPPPPPPPPPAAAPDLSRTIPAPQTLRAGPTRLTAPRRISLRSLRRSKCVLVRVASLRPARVLVTIFSGRRSVRLFGQELVRFRRPGRRTVCIAVPLRARTFDLRTFLRVALGYRLGVVERVGERPTTPAIRPIQLLP